VKAERVVSAIWSCNSFGRSANVTLGWIAWTSRNSWFGNPPDARFRAARASSTAEKIIDCMTSPAALVIFPSLDLALAPP